MSIIREVGCCSTASLSPNNLLRMSVLTPPGEIDIHLILLFSTSFATDSVNPLTANYAEQYADNLGTPLLPDLDDTLIIIPEFCFFIMGSIYFIILKVVITLSFITA